jgi:Flp pilus assembly protein protease CpaA
MNEFLPLVSAVVIAALIMGVLYQRRKWRRIQAATDGVVLRCLTQTHESLVRDVTEPHGGVLYTLQNLETLHACLGLRTRGVAR